MVPYTDIEQRRAASRRHYRANASAMKDRAKAFTATARLRNKEYIDAAKSVPCADCGNTYPPYVMQFDHVRGAKLFNLADAVNRGRSLASIQEEIDKCEVVCANCHATRTYNRRMQAAKAAVAE